MTLRDHHWRAMTMTLADRLKQIAQRNEAIRSQTADQTDTPTLIRDLCESAKADVPYLLEVARVLYERERAEEAWTDHRHCCKVCREWDTGANPEGAGPCMAGSRLIEESARAFGRMRRLLLTGELPEEADHA